MEFEPKFLNFWRTCSGWVIEIAFVFAEEIAEQNICLKIFLGSWMFSVLGRKTSRAWADLFRQMGNLCVQKNFVTGKMLCRETSFYNCFQNGLEIIELPKKNWISGKISILRFQTNHLWEKFLYQKVLFSDEIFWTLIETFFDLLVNFLRQICHYSILRVPRNFSRKFFLKKTISLFLDFEQQIWTFEENGSVAKTLVSSTVKSRSGGGWSSLCIKIGYSEPSPDESREGTSTQAESYRVT